LQLKNLKLHPFLFLKQAYEQKEFFSMYAHDLKQIKLTLTLTLDLPWGHGSLKGWFSITPKQLLQGVVFLPQIVCWASPVHQNLKLENLETYLGGMDPLNDGFPSRQSSS
jgi:hypothetical protein